MYRNADSRPLPSGWTDHFDPQSQRWYYRSRTQTTWVHPSDSMVMERVDKTIAATKTSSQPTPALSRAQQIYQSAFADGTDSSTPMIAPPTFNHQQGSEDRPLGRSTSAQASLPSSSTPRPSAITVQHTAPLRSNTDLPDRREPRRISTIATQPNPHHFGATPVDITIPVLSMPLGDMQSPVNKNLPPVPPSPIANQQHPQYISHPPFNQTQPSPTAAAPPSSPLAPTQQQHHPTLPVGQQPTAAFLRTVYASPGPMQNIPPPPPPLATPMQPNHQAVTRPSTALSTSSVPTTVPEQQQFQPSSHSSRPLRGRAQTAPAAPHLPVSNVGSPPQSQRSSRGFGRTAGMISAAAVGLVGGALLGGMISEEGDGGELFSGVGDAIANSFGGEAGEPVMYEDPTSYAAPSDPYFTASGAETAPQGYAPYNYAVEPPPPQDSSAWSSAPQQQPQDQSGFASHLGDFAHHAIFGDGSSNQQSSQSTSGQQQQQYAQQAQYGQQQQGFMQSTPLQIPQYGQSGQQPLPPPPPLQPSYQGTQVTYPPNNQQTYAQPNMGQPQHPPQNLQYMQPQQTGVAQPQMQSQPQPQVPPQLQPGPPKATSTPTTQNTTSNALTGFAGRLLVAGTAAMIGGLVSNA